MGSADEDGKRMKMAMALGGRTTCRPCDLCGDQPARWYCVADKAYFCDFYDASFHTANSVAWRHNRLKTIPEYQPTNEMKVGRASSPFEESARALHEFEEEMGFECLIGKPSADEEPVCLEFCRPTATAVSSRSCGTEFMDSCVPMENDTDFPKGSNSLGDDKGNTPHSFLCGGIRMKVENTSLDGLEFNNVKVEKADAMKMKVECFESKEKAIRLMLRLNYQDVLTAWSNRGSPWADDNPIPRFELLEADAQTSDGTGNQLDCCGVVPESESKGPQHVPVISTSNVREARVIRYREKRRSRLFSKKIRYQVRKLNAEKRPRMKGRFVKRSASSICLE